MRGIWSPPTAGEQIAGIIGVIAAFALPFAMIWGPIIVAMMFVDR